MDKKVDPFYLEHERKVVSYLINNPFDEYQVDEKIISDFTLNIILVSIKKLVRDRLTVNVNNLLLECKSRDSSIEEEFVEELRDLIIEGNDFKFFVRHLKDNYIRNIANKEVLDNIIIELKSNKTLDVDSLRKNINRLDKNLVNLYRENFLLTAKDLSETHKNTVRDRREGDKKRSLGFRCLDEKVLKPGQEEEISLLISSTGGAKSLFSKTIENILINKRVPVLSINPEMNRTQTMDRLVCMRDNIDPEDLVRVQDRATMSRVYKSLNTFSNLGNYLFTDNPVIYLKDVEDLIEVSRNIFRKNGSFIDNKDEYIFVTIDLLSMLRDFKGANYQDVIDNMDILHEIAKRQKVHFFGVIQANDRKIKENMVSIKKPEDVQYLKIGLEDVKGGSSWNERARLIMSITRPVELKRRFFPDRIDEWNCEEDVINLHGIKQNEKGLFFLQFILNTDNLRIVPR